jgi:hypothetical protein
MAEHKVAFADGHPDMDYAEHEKTYKFFINFVRYGAASIILVLIFLAFSTL